MTLPNDVGAGALELFYAAIAMRRSDDRCSPEGAAATRISSVIVGFSMMLYSQFKKRLALTIGRHE